MEFLGRFMQRQEGRDAPTSDAARDAQYDAIVEWGIPDHAALQRLTGIGSPTLVIQGDGDLMIPTKLSHLMAGLIPDARIRIYPDAAHGFLFQYPAEVAAEVNAFPQLGTSSDSELGSVPGSSRRERIPSFVNTLPRCHSTVRGLRNSRAPISGLERPSRAS